MRVAVRDLLQALLLLRLRDPMQRRMARLVLLSSSPLPFIPTRSTSCPRTPRHLPIAACLPQSMPRLPPRCLPTWRLALREQDFSRRTAVRRRWAATSLTTTLIRTVPDGMTRSPMDVTTRLRQRAPGPHMPMPARALSSLSMLSRSSPGHSEARLPVARRNRLRLSRSTERGLFSFAFSPCCSYCIEPSPLSFAHVFGPHLVTSALLDIKDTHLSLLHCSICPANFRLMHGVVICNRYIVMMGGLARSPFPYCEAPSYTPKVRNLVVGLSF